MNPNFVVGHSQLQKRIRKSNTSAHWLQYDFLIRGYRANPLQDLFTVASCLATANSRMNEISLKGCGIRRGSPCKAGPKPAVARTSADEMVKPTAPKFCTNPATFLPNSYQTGHLLVGKG